MLKMLRGQDDKIKTFYGALALVFIEPFKKAKKNYTGVWRENRKKALLLSLLFVFLVIVSLFFSISVFGRSTKGGTQTHSPSTTDIRAPSTGEEQEDPGSVEKVAVTEFLKVYEQTIEFFRPILDSFISQTADVTGKSVPTGNGYSFNPFASHETEFITGETMEPATNYSNKALMVIVPVATILIIVQGFNFMSGGGTDREELKDFIMRVVLTVAMLIVTPTILSLSILATNLLVLKFTGGQPLTEFMSTFIASLQQDYEAGTSDYFLSGLQTLLTGGVGGVTAIFQALPIVLPLMLILLLLLYISFKFIIRYLYLYFLTAVYPFTVVFYIHPKTAGIPRAFWKQWTTFLIHAPAFVLAYTIVQNILLNMLQNNGSSFVMIVIFIGLLLFMSSIDILVGRIWGDAYAAIAGSITAGVGAYMTKNILVDKPAGAIGDFKRGASGGPVTGVASKLGKESGKKLRMIRGQTPSVFKASGKSSGGVLSTASEGTIVKHKTMKDGTGTMLAQDLEKKGYKVGSSDPTSGVLGVGGDFYAHKNNETGQTTLYTSPKDAKLDGVKADELQKASIDNMNIRDTSNYQGTQQYNRAVGKFAKEKGYKGKVHLKMSASDGWVKNNMRLGKGYNKVRNVDGVMVNRFAKNAKKGDPSGKISKVHIYSELLEGDETS